LSKKKKERCFVREKDVLLPFPLSLAYVVSLYVTTLRNADADDHAIGALSGGGTVRPDQVRGSAQSITDGISSHSLRRIAKVRRRPCKFTIATKEHWRQGIATGQFSRFPRVFVHFPGRIFDFQHRRRRNKSRQRRPPSSPRNKYPNFRELVKNYVVGHTLLQVSLNTTTTFYFLCCIIQYIRIFDC